MSFEERVAELRVALEAEISRARSAAVADLIRIAQRARTPDHAAALAEAERAFAGIAGVAEFLRSLAPPAVPEKDLPAQRFARVRVAEIQLYHAAAMKTGRAAGDVYGALKAQMDAAREAYRESFLTPANGTADYLHAEFVRSLASDNAALLGPGYPGPLA